MRDEELGKKYKKEIESLEKFIEEDERQIDNYNDDIENIVKELNKIEGHLLYLPTTIKSKECAIRLAEIYNLEIPVPPGFVVTAQAYDYFIEKAELKEKIKKLLVTIDYQDTKQLNEVTEKIRDLINTSKFPKEMEEEIGAI